jgi:hypothetical protein
VDVNPLQFGRGSDLHVVVPGSEIARRQWSALPVVVAAGSDGFALPDSLLTGGVPQPRDSSLIAHQVAPKRLIVNIAKSERDSIGGLI